MEEQLYKVWLIHTIILFNPSHSQIEFQVETGGINGQQNTTGTGGHLCFGRPPPVLVPAVG